MNRYLSSLSILLLAVSLSSYAQNSIATSARSAGMGGTGLTFQDANSAFSNQAGLATVENLGGLVTAESRFARSPINTFAGAFILPSKFGAFGLTLQHYGVETFNQQKIGLAYARKLSKGLSIGAQFDFINVSIPSYGSKGAVTFEAGLQATITKELRFGVHVFSPTNIDFTEDLSVPTIYRAGLTYLPSSKTYLTLELEKDIDFPTRVRMGVEYRFIESFFLRVGAATAPTLISVGIGIQVPTGLGIDITSSYHQILGVTPSISISYTPKTKQ